MSGKRLVSSVQITLAPPWRAEVSRRTQSRTLHEEYGRPARQTPSQPAPRDEQPETEHGDFQNGGTSFHHSFLDEVHTTEDFFSSHLPPPLPSPPVSRKTFTRQEPLPGPPAPVSGKTQKQIPRDLPPPALDSFPDFPPPVSLKVQKKIPRDPLPKHPAPASLSLDLRKLDLSEPTSGQKPSSVIPTEVNPSRHENASYVQQKREHPASEKPGHNGHSAKLDNGGSDICAFCHKTILPSAATIEAMKKQYHASCFTCRKCHRLLAGQQYYQKDGQPICDHCYKETLEKCAKCQTLITHHIVRAMGNGYHPECFTCVICNRMIADESFAVDEYNDVHCAEDYYRKYAPICSVCDEPIIPREDDEDSYKIECLGRNFHENCYRCEKCHIALSLEPTDSGCYPLQGHILCKPCHLAWTDQS